VSEGRGVTEDTLLDGRVRLRQPASGYRVAIDPVLLAAAVAAAPGDSVLELGCGVGAAALCLAARLPAVRVVGIEAQREMVRLANDNVVLNGQTARVSVMLGDLLRPPPRLEPGTFALVMANPPFLERERAAPSPDPAKAAAQIEGEADFAAWLRCALTMLQPKGSFVFIHRADRLEHVLAQLAGRTGDIAVLPLWPGVGKPARRVIVRARKGVAAPTCLLPGLVLHEADGRFTDAAEAVLRRGAALPLQPAPLAGG